MSNDNCYPFVTSGQDFVCSQIVIGNFGPPISIPLAELLDWSVLEKGKQGRVTATVLEKINTHTHTHTSANLIVKGSSEIYRRREF